MTRTEKKGKWVDYDDGSGHMELPDGSACFYYDIKTQQYKIRPSDDWFCFAPFEREPESVEGFHQMAEKWLAQNLAQYRENDAFKVAQVILPVERHGQGTGFSADEAGEHIAKVLEKIKSGEIERTREISRGRDSVFEREL